VWVGDRGMDVSAVVAGLAVGRETAARGLGLFVDPLAALTEIPHSWSLPHIEAGLSRN
jgi:hypothetical protein